MGTRILSTERGSVKLTTLAVDERTFVDTENRLIGKHSPPWTQYINIRAISGRCKRARQLSSCLSDRHKIIIIAKLTSEPQLSMTYKGNSGRLTFVDGVAKMARIIKL